MLDTGGTGPPMLFLHGHSGSWQHWLEQIPAFMEAHRVIAVDLPGFGKSEMPIGELSISAYAQALESVLDQLEVTAACVVGNSMGGFVAAELALACPPRVERLVLVSAAGLASRYVGIPVAAIRHRGGVAVARTLLGRGVIPEPVARSLSRRPRGRTAAFGLVVAHPDRLHPAMALELMRGIGQPAGAPALLALAAYDYRERLGEVACPALVVWGDRDRFIGVDSAAEYERAISDSRSVIYPDTGHLPMIERPERFNADLRKFLAETAGVPSPEHA